MRCVCFITVLFIDINILDTDLINKWIIYYNFTGRILKTQKYHEYKIKKLSKMRCFGAI